MISFDKLKLGEFILTKKICCLTLVCFIFLFSVACGTASDTNKDSISEGIDIETSEASNNEVNTESGHETNNKPEQGDQEAQEGQETYNKEQVGQDNQGYLLEPNETGQVMVLMYHRLGDKEDTWVRTWDNFRRDLEALYEEGYRLISFKDYLDNNIDLPAGYSPVILTFDDGHKSQFDIEKVDDKWVLKEQTAAGILYNFYQENPDFGLEATFYVNSRPFNYQYWQEALQYLVYELGMDIGNHTQTHINMKQTSAQKIAEEVGGLVKEFSEVIPDYEIDSIALPFGIYPPDGIDLTGTYDGIEYKNRGILLVGSNPAPSPIAKKYNPLKIPRVRADEENLYKWLEYFKKNPHLRYVSDGDPDTISIPSDMIKEVKTEVFEDSGVKVYYRESK
jgi:peptidoglycan/xylan/chitin deacetylase (PgdA/CDA1 family)